MAEETTETAVTLRRELQKLLTDNFYDGEESKDRGESDDGSYGAKKTIDEAIRVLTCLREVESKIPESDNNPSSSSVEVPKEFKCPITNEIMIQPVLIASGQTFEERYISQYLEYERTCPKTKEVLSNSLWTPNHLVDEFITKWCRVYNYDRPKPSDVIDDEMYINDVKSLLERISNSFSVEDQVEAARELRNQTKKFASVRYFFVTDIDGSLTRLLLPLSPLSNAVADWNPELQENLVAILYNISIVEQNKSVIATNSFAERVLAKSLKQGTIQTRRYSAATLRSLALLASNRFHMADSEALKALISVIEDGDYVATLEAGSAIMNLCILTENIEKAISAGFIDALTKTIKAGSNVAELLSFLALLSTNTLVVEKMEELGFIDDLFKIFRKPSCSVVGEKALDIVFNMCFLTTSDPNRISKRLELVDEEENKHGTFSKIAKEGSDPAVRKAQAILKWHKRFGTGKEPMSSE